MDIQMTQLRILVAVLFIAVTAYTLITVTTHGWDFLSVFLADLVSLTWRGQFTLDFGAYLLLSGLWVAWRGGFSGGSIALGALASVMGMLVFGVLMLLFIARCNGDARKLLLGVHAEPAR